LGGRAVFSVEDADIVRVLRALGAPVGVRDTPAPVALIDRALPTGAAEVRRRQAQGQRVCLLDDPGPGRLLAELVVDPPTAPSWPAAGRRRLGGFEHVLLRREVRAAARRGVAGAEARVDVLLSLGGSDPEGLTPALAEVLTAAGMSVLSVLGPAYRGPRPRGDLLEDPREWPRALAKARLLVSRFGHTLLEAAHLGTPALAIAGGERAAREAMAFALHGTIEAIRVERPEDIERVADRALALRGDDLRLQAMGRRGRELVDGLGAMRVTAALRELA
jgi:hypothetical protein